MAKSTAPILAVGGITFFNKWIGNGDGKPQYVDFKILLGTAVAAGALALFEKAQPELAVGIAWIALITAFVAPLGGGNSAITNLSRMSGLSTK